MGQKSSNGDVVIETHRSGHFLFQAGVNLEALNPLIERIQEAHSRFSSLPILPEWSTLLEKEVVVSSIFGTDTIEGGTLSEEETAKIVDSPEDAKEEKEKRVKNLVAAYEYAVRYGLHALGKSEINKAGSLILIEEMFLDLHKDVTGGLVNLKNTPGQYRDNEKGLLTKVGDAEHGGVYVAPKCLDDIKMLMTAFLGWSNSKEILSLDPLVRASLAHYYFERIHPFGDGNGRVGRVVEAMLLKAAGYRYAPFALSRYYLENVDEYFSVFNAARKSGERKDKYPNTVFVEFFLKGMLVVMNEQYDRIKELIAILVHNTYILGCLERGEINKRQYAILKTLQDVGGIERTKLEKLAWYEALYDSLTPKTRRRDFNRLVEGGFISLDEHKVVQLEIPGLESGQT